MVFSVENSKRFIFVADDDEDDIYLLTEAIFEVDPSVSLKQVTDGINLMETLYTLSGPLPEILFLDINMPGKSGFECLKEIRKQEGSIRKINIIILSTSSNPATIEMAFNLGATFYAVKPNTFDDLKSFLEVVLKIDWENLSCNRQFRLI